MNPSTMAAVPLEPVEDINTLRQENKKLLQKVAVLEKELQTYELDGVKGFYYNIKRWVNNCNELINLKASNIATLVSGEGKDFERMMTLIKSTKENVETLRELEKVLGILREIPKEDQDKIKPISPESVAHVLGDNRQQQV